MGKLLAVLLLAVPVLAGPPEEFASDLEQLKKFGREGRWKLVSRKLPALLAAHKEAPYVRAHRAAIVDLARRAAFRAKYPPLDPKSVVKGELLSWNPRSRKVKVRYDRKQMENWIKSGEFLFHPAVFTGPHTITLDGKYPKNDSPHAVVCFDGNRSFYVIFGLNGKSAQKLAAITYHEGKRKLNEVISDSLCTDTANFPVRVVVKNKAVIATRGSRRILSLRKKADHWGRFGFLASDWIESVMLEGPVEPAWMQGLLDKAETARRKEFEFAFDPEEHLPEWLFEMPDVGTELAEPDRRQWPGKLTAKETDLIERVEQICAEGRYEEGAAMAASYDDADEAVVQFLKAMCLFAMADHAKALPCAQRVVELDPKFVPARELQARLLAQLGKHDEAAAVYDALLAQYPGGAELYGNAAMLLLSIGRAKEAGRVLGRAQVNNLSSPTLDHVHALVTKAANGPAWPRAYEHKSRHYHVITDIDKKTCVEAAKILERAYVLYTVRLDRVPDAEQRRFRVYLFSGREGYLKYTADVLGEASKNSAGLYHTLLKQFLIWNLPEREEMMQTVRHEGFHQYLDRLMSDPPAWFNEGLAEYYEIARIHRGQWRLGDPNPYHLKVLADKGIMPLKEFLYRDHATFMQKALENYAQSWAFIRFLRHSTRENAQLFDRFWEAFKTIPSRKAALDHALEGVDLKALEKEFREHVSAG